MPKLPYFRWYPADAETDENFRGMTDAEIGFYVRCLNHSWMNGGLPADPEERARALREKQLYADRMWVRVGRCFELDPSGRMVNKRQEAERSKAISTSQNNKRAGNANASKTRQEREANGLQHAPARAESVSDSDSCVCISKSEWPELTKAIQEPFPSTDGHFILRIVQESIQGAISDDIDPNLVTDSVLAEAVQTSMKTDNVKRAGLLLKTVPQIVRSWGKQER